MSYDQYGLRRRDPGLDRVLAEETAGMMFPVRCAHCPGVYDLGAVTVTGRYADCSVWKSPCCGLTVDDRGETGWKSRGDYVRLDRNGREVRR